jgi:hypothetical protein
VDPTKKMVIVRLGSKEGKVNWSRVLDNVIAEQY